MERLRALREVYECLLDEIIVKRQGPRSSGFYENPQRTLAPETVFDVTLAPVDPAHILAAANAALAVEQVIAIEKQRALVAMAESSDVLEPRRYAGGASSVRRSEFRRPAHERSGVLPNRLPGTGRCAA